MFILNVFLIKSSVLHIVFYTFMKTKHMSRISIQINLKQKKSRWSITYYGSLGAVDITVRQGVSFNFALVILSKKVNF